MANGTSPPSPLVVEKTVASTFGRLISALACRTICPSRSTVTSRRLPESEDLRFPAVVAVLAFADVVTADVPELD